MPGFAEAAIQRDDGVTNILRVARVGRQHFTQAGDAAEIPVFVVRVLGSFVADDEQGIARLQPGGGAGQVNGAQAHARRHGFSGEHRQRIPADLGVDGFERLEGLRRFVLAGYALGAGADVDASLERRAGRRFEGEGEPGRSRHAGAQFVADGAGQFEHRAAFGGGAQVVFVADAFLVEAQHVKYGGPAVEQGDCRVVAGAGGQVFEGRLVGEVGQHALPEAAVGADAQCQRRLAGRLAVVDRRQRRDADAAAALIGSAHDPPSTMKLIWPFSGKLRSPSARRTSS